MGFQTVLRKHEGHNRPHHSGELHWNARLTDYEVTEILKRCNRGECYSLIADAFGISRNHVRLLHRRERRNER